MPHNAPDPNRSYVRRRLFNDCISQATSIEDEISVYAAYFTRPEQKALRTIARELRRLAVTIDRET